MARLLIGTSGWVYRSWKGPFYPDTLPSRRYLEYYARTFPTAEINTSFYHLPRPATCAAWAEQVPPAFVFSIKVSRYLTHMKRLLDPEEPWQRFMESALQLGDRLGPILLQFPPSFRKNTSRLENFFKMATSAPSRSTALQLVCEFRHDSWLGTEVYRLLDHYKVAWCIADGPRYPRKDLVTGTFAYIRYHGRSQMFASNYTDEELKSEAKLIRRYLRKGVDVYVYFNNDAMGYAVNNAQRLSELIKK